MNQRKIRVGLLFGGRSAEHEVSLISARAVYKNLDRRKHRAICIYINKKGEWKRVASPLLPREKLDQGPSFSFLPWAGKNRGRFASDSRSHQTSLRADIYFPILHGPYGEDGTIQGLLEMADVAYVGAGVLASAVGMDKAVMKALFASKNLPIVKYRTLRDAEWAKNKGEILSSIKKEFALPFFVKPANLGSSVGITKIKEYEKMRPALDRAFRYDRKILVEQGISGREIECSVLGNDKPRASLPGEVIPFREFYDYRDKYIEGKTQFRIPIDFPEAVVREVQRLAVRSFKAAECSGMARIDFFLEDKTKKIYVNEINTIPGFTEISMYPKLWEASGLPFPRLIDKLISLGLERHRKKKRCLGELSP